MSVVKTNQLMLYGELVALCSEINRKHISTLCGKKVEIFNVEYSGVWRTHWALKWYTRPLHNICPYDCYTSRKYSKLYHLGQSHLEISDCGHKAECSRLCRHKKDNVSNSGLQRTKNFYIYVCIHTQVGARSWWRSWLRHCATSRKVAGSISDGVIGFFSLT